MHGNGTLGVTHHSSFPKHTSKRISPRVHMQLEKRGMPYFVPAKNPKENPLLHRWPKTNRKSHEAQTVLLLQQKQTWKTDPDPVSRRVRTLVGGGICERDFERVKRKI